MTIAWTALFHAIFHRRGTKPWYEENGSGGEVKYKMVDGEPWHWELAECTRRYYLADNPPQRKNLEFMIALRNKIEHRDHPELDPALYGQCQAMLMNFEELLTKEFGDEHAVSGQLSVALQFSALRPEAQKQALGRLESSTATDLLDFIRQFHAELPREVLDSSSYSLRVFLVPRLANRAKSADLAVRFVSYDPSRPEEMEALRAVTALIKDRHVAVASHGLKKPSGVVRLLGGCLPYRVTMHTHTMAWKFYDVRPATGAEEARGYAIAILRLRRPFGQLRLYAGLDRSPLQQTWQSTGIRAGNWEAPRPRSEEDSGRETLESPRGQVVTVDCVFFVPTLLKDRRSDLADPEAHVASLGPNQAARLVGPPRIRDVEAQLFRSTIFGSAISTSFLPRSCSRSRMRRSYSLTVVSSAKTAR